MDWAKTITRRDEKHLSDGIRCDLYKRFDCTYFTEVYNMEYEELLSKVGSFGRYQWILISMVCILFVSDCFIFMGYVFITALPDHWCRLPDTGGNITLEEMKAAFLPIEVKDGIASYRWETREGGRGRSHYRQPVIGSTDTGERKIKREERYERHEEREREREGGGGERGGERKKKREKVDKRETMREREHKIHIQILHSHWNSQ